MSYTASVQAEELLVHKQQIAAIDPTGAWWVLLSSASGEGPGFPVVVFGGDHADVPLGFVEAVRNGVVRGSGMLFLKGKARGR